MTTVAKRYGISDVVLRKNCKRLKVPTPPNGYWAKVQAGQKTKIPPLFKSNGPNKIVVTDRSSTHSISSAVLKKYEQLSFLAEEQRQAVKVYCSSLTVPPELSHPQLICTSRRLLYFTEKGALLKFNMGVYEEDLNRERYGQSNC